MERVIWAKRVIVIISFLLIGFIIYQYLSYPWLWYDEAGQFWISKGLNHYSSPYETPQGLLQVIENNRYYNLDPGGFSILLHFWLFISNESFFIRLFPLLFFICFSFFVYQYIYELTDRKFYAFLCSISFFLWDVTARLMVEVRAYSMEICGIIISLWLLNKYTKYGTISVRHLFFLSLVLCFFCTSRYDFIIYSFGFSIYIYTLILLHKKKTLNILTYSIPLSITVSSIYLITTIYQNSTADKLHYLQYLDELITTYALLYNHLFILFILNGLIVLFHIQNRHKISHLQILSILIPLIVCVLSIMGKCPWDKMRTISVLLLIVINLMVEIGKTKQIPTLVCVIFSFFVMSFIGVIPEYVKGKEGYSYEAFLEIIQKNSKKKIFIDRSFNPSVRYIYEYGRLSKEKKEYADKFYFQIGRKHCFRNGQKLEPKEPIVDGNKLDCEYYLVQNEHKNITKIGDYIYQKKRLDIKRNQ